ncbi:hypothetical protein PT974_03438 [Cladobotryum mycophilum]|uniref:Uncharacterized protein n=1 Tax=Cladobotryum mycophilum TaxID=491253 RepID=A0ABR0STG3_9HYPO
MKASVLLTSIFAVVAFALPQITTTSLTCAELCEGLTGPDRHQCLKDCIESH